MRCLNASGSEKFHPRSSDCIGKVFSNGRSAEVSLSCSHSRNRVSTSNRVREAEILCRADIKVSACDLRVQTSQFFASLPSFRVVWGISSLSAS